jgi:uncharacterized protein with HEPN domain
MPPEGRDAAYLWDIVEAARTIRDFTRDVSLADYARDRKLQLAIERALEIVGEAARRLSDTFRAEHPEVPWPQLIAQRNVLAHEYGEIKKERIWLVATQRIPELIGILEPLLPVPPTPESPTTD